MIFLKRTMKLVDYKQLKIYRGFLKLITLVEIVPRGGGRVKWSLFQKRVGSSFTPRDWPPPGFIYMNPVRVINAWGGSENLIKVRNL